MPTPNPTPKPLLGIVLMLCAMGILPFLDVCAKYLGRMGLPIVEIVWARLFFGMLLTLPFALRIVGPRGLMPDPPIMHTCRGLFLCGATFFFFWALKSLPIADTLAIFFVQPLIITVLSPFVLGEKVGIRRWMAVIIGFIGTLVIIRPGFQEFNPGMVLALLAGLCLAIYMLLTRKMSGRTHAMVTTFHTNVAGLKRFGEPKLARLSITSALVASLGYAFASSGWMLYVLIVANFLSFAATPALQGIISKSAHEDEQGLTQGALNAIASLSTVIAPMIGAPLLAQAAHLPPHDWRLGATFLASAALQAVALLLTSIHIAKREAVAPAA